MMNYIKSKLETFGVYIVNVGDGVRWSWYRTEYPPGILGRKYKVK